MATRAAVLAAGCVLALAAAGGVGYLLLARTPAPKPGTGAPVQTPAVEGDPAGGVPGVLPGGGGVRPPVDPAPNGAAPDGPDRDPSGPEGGYTTEDILAAVAKGDWQAVESMLRTSGSEDPRVTDAIAKGLSDDRWRPMILGLAEFLKDPGATEKFLAMARGDANENTRAAAIQAAALTGGPGVLEAAQEILKSAKPGGMLAGCTLLALGSMKGAQAPEAARILTALLRDRVGTPGSAAVVESLSRIRSPEALAALGELLQDAESPAHFRAALAEAMGKTRDAAVVNDLLRTVRDTADDALRNACYRALALVGSEEAVKELIQVVHGSDNGRRLEAAQALSGLTGRSSAPLIEEALRSTVDPALRGYLVTAVGRTGGKHSLEFLDGLAGNFAEDEGIRRTAVKAMGQIGDPAASPLLTDILERTPRTEENRNLRIQCLESLIGLIRPEEQARLKRLIEDTPVNTPEWYRMNNLVNLAAAERIQR